jgi:hypothetical protein
MYLIVGWHLVTLCPVMTASKLWRTTPIHRLTHSFFGANIGSSFYSFHSYFIFNITLHFIHLFLHRIVVAFITVVQGFGDTFISWYITTNNNNNYYVWFFLSSLFILLFVSQGYHFTVKQSWDSLCISGILKLK